MPHIRIEPRKHFDKAIHKVRKDGYITYNYWVLVEVCMRINNESLEDAKQCVEYNILGLNDSEESLFKVRGANQEAPSRLHRKVGKVHRR